MLNKNLYMLVGNPTCKEHSCRAEAFDSYFGYAVAFAYWVHGSEIVVTIE